MNTESVIKQRKFLHNLIQDRDVSVPLVIDLGDGTHVYEETFSCFCWNDEDEVVYIVSANTSVTATNDNRLLPALIEAIPYESIMTMKARVDRNVLDHFFKEMVDKGLSDEDTRKHYFNELTKIYDAETYLTTKSLDSDIGDSYKSTEKRPDPYVNREGRDIELKDQILDPDALHTL